MVCTLWSIIPDILRLEEECSGEPYGELRGEAVDVEAWFASKPAEILARLIGESGQTGKLTL